MAIANLWLAVSQQSLDEFRYKRQGCSMDDSDPPVCVAPYTGPMDDETFRILSKMADTDNVQRMFKVPNIAGKDYNLFSLYINGSAAAKDAVDYIAEKWPGHLITLGAWRWDGRQVGTEWELDTEGERTGEVAGTPLYPVHAQAWRLMPDVVEYDENGDEVSRTPASSNADLKDINLLQGQSPRQFTQEIN